MGKKQRINILIAMGCLLVASSIYILFRPATLLMFRWANSLGLMGMVKTLRFLVNGAKEYIPTCIIYSLPFALWVSSCMLFINAIWWHSSSWARNIWLHCIPVIAITSEIGQALHIVPGVFDFIDMLTIILCSMCVFVATQFNQFGKGVKQT